ncbi:RagB/SusD family nutrient uptake outer membrane protein [Phocaeicola vulgatus]|uniref:RagB/SusD family nutrient uptake outer membrane protein n=1 Tax=Phocaeicola vulgatus TaxID=821 RepID=UPI0021D00C5B|nr:RagB/SusD family nutrient uptake outer membrane protein [Phocaeicola vulgatus]
MSAYSGTGDVLKTEIQNERRRELFAEGHRLFDLKRRDLPMDRSNLTLDWSRVGLIPAGSDKLEMPIPQNEIDANGALTIADQNPAYK